MYVTVTTDVDVNVEPRHFATEDLLEELSRRHVKSKLTMDVDDAVDILKENGCPGDLLEPIMDWARQPIINTMMLKYWYDFCGVEIPKSVMVISGVAQAQKEETK